MKSTIRQKINFPLTFVPKTSIYAEVEIRKNEGVICNKQLEQMVYNQALISFSIKFSQSFRNKLFVYLKHETFVPPPIHLHVSSFSDEHIWNHNAPERSTFKW